MLRISGRLDCVVFAHHRRGKGDNNRAFINEQRWDGAGKFAVYNCLGAVKNLLPVSFAINDT